MWRIACRFVISRRGCLVHARSNSHNVHVQLLPNSDCFFDEAVHVRVQGLLPHQRVKLRSKLLDDKGGRFAACALYEADESGLVDVEKSASLGGSYTGIEPMGLFWSMTPDKPHSRLAKSNVLSPLTVDIDVCQEADDVLLASETNVRHFMKEGMRRIEVKEGRIRGVLFLPPGDGPFPGVIDLYTFGGGLCEIRASLLANKGFAVLAFAFYKYQDLPKTVPECFELEYFEEGITFLRGHPQVKSSGVGVLCLSKSGDFALSMASYLEGVSATAWVNGCNAVNVIPLSYKGVVMPPVEVDPAKARFTEDGLIILHDVITDPTLEKNQGSVIHVEQASGRFLFAASEYDLNWNSCMFADQAVARLRDHGKDTYELVRYPKAGHLLETPYTALCTSGIHAALGMVVVFGGEAKAHCEAQLDLWKRVQEFFRKYV